MCVIGDACYLTIAQDLNVAPTLHLILARYIIQIYLGTEFGATLVLGYKQVPCFRVRKSVY